MKVADEKIDEIADLLSNFSYFDFESPSWLARSTYAFVRVRGFIRNSIEGIIGPERCPGVCLESQGGSVFF